MEEDGPVVIQMADKSMIDTDEYKDGEVKPPTLTIKDETRPHSGNEVPTERNSESEAASEKLSKKVLSESELAQEKTLFEAVVSGDLDTIRNLQKEGVQLSTKNEQGNPLIHYAVKAGHTTIVALLLEHQVDVNATNPNGTSPLHLAAFSGFNEILEMLCYTGAHVNHQDSSGNTALHFSCQFNHPDTSMMLINFSSKLDIINGIGDIPLHGACRNGMLQVVVRMCSLGYPINNANGHGETPLHLAVKSGNCEVVRTLMLHGAKHNKLDRDGKTPEDLATDPEMLKLFSLYNQVIQSGSQNKKFELRNQLVSSDKPLNRLKVAFLGNSGVGKTTVIESLKCGFLKSFLWSSYYTISKSSKVTKETVTDVTAKGKVDGTQNNNYTRGVSIQNTSISDIGEVMLFDYSGLQSYYDQFSLFLGDSSTIHLIVISMNDTAEERLNQVDFWLEFIRLRMSPKEPMGFAGCNMWAPNVFIIATGADETNSSKNDKGEWFLKDEEKFLSSMIEKYEKDVIVNRPVFVLDAQLPGSPEMKGLKRIISKLKSYIQNFLPTQMGCLDQTLLELPTFRTSLAAFPVVTFKEFADFVRVKVNLLASDDNIRELLVQLQLMGEIICFGSNEDEVIILNPNWLGSEVIGKLLSYDVMQTYNVWSGFVSESFLRNIFQKFDITKIMDLLKSLNICYERSTNNGKEFYIHMYNRMDFDSLDKDWLEDWKSASLKSVVRLATVRPVKDQLVYIFSHVISALHIVFIDKTGEFGQWKNACRVFEAGKTAIITLENETGSITIRCHSNDGDASKLFLFTETICAIVYSSADQHCPGLFLQRLPACWFDCKNAVSFPSFYKPEQILSDQLESPKKTVQLNAEAEPEHLIDVLTFGSKHEYNKFIISTEAHVSCLSYFARCQLAWYLDKNIELCQKLAKTLNVDEKAVPIEPGTLSIFDRMMTYWSTDASVTLRKLCEALKECDAQNVVDVLLQLTPIFVYLPSVTVIEQD